MSVQGIVYEALKKSNMVMAYEVIARIGLIDDRDMQASIMDAVFTAAKGEEDARMYQCDDVADQLKELMLEKEAG